MIRSVAIVVNKNNNFGLAKDAELLKNAWQIWGRSHGSHGLKITILDPREPPIACDVAIHLEQVHPVWFPWASVQVAMVNAEWWFDEWNSYIANFDIMIFKNKADAVSFCETRPLRENMVVYWLSTIQPSDFPASSKENSFVYFLGGSKNKIAAAKRLLPLWSEQMAPIKVFTTVDIGLDQTALAKNVTIVKTDLSPAMHRKEAAKYKGHVCCSYAESFGFTAAEAVAAGAYLVFNGLPVYNEYYGSCPSAINIGDLSGSDVSLVSALELASEQLVAADPKNLAKSQKNFFENMVSNFKNTFENFADAVATKISAAPKIPQLPPVLAVADCPSITIITPLYCYERFINLALYNIMTTDYPLEKITWTIVDATPTHLSKGPVILGMADKIAPATLNYIPATDFTTIGNLRNRAVRYSPNDIIVCMDLDDYYPPTAIRRKVAWLLHNPAVDAVSCTAIAGYCLKTGRSFMTVPPYGLGLAKRCSEASMVFKRSFWDERGFPDDVTVAEGEGFLEGRTDRVCEIPPFQQIVSFIHGENTSGRYIPEEAESKKPSNTFGFTKNELKFFHGLIGVEVE
jgi:hypothetical protein